jgi:glutamine synthetase
MVVPAAVTAINEYTAAGAACGALNDVVAEMSDLVAKTLAGIKAVDTAEGTVAQIAAMDELRAAVDALEGVVPADLWPLPSYAEMLFS